MDDPASHKCEFKFFDVFKRDLNTQFDKSTDPIFFSTQQLHIELRSAGDYCVLAVKERKCISTRRTSAHCKIHKILCSLISGLLVIRNFSSLHFIPRKVVKSIKRWQAQQHEYNFLLDKLRQLPHSLRLCNRRLCEKKNERERNIHQFVKLWYLDEFLHSVLETSEISHDEEASGETVRGESACVRRPRPPSAGSPI